jgi:hypothetical protein
VKTNLDKCEKVMGEEREKSGKERNKVVQIESGSVFYGSVLKHDSKSECCYMSRGWEVSKYHFEKKRRQRRRSPS